MLKLKITEQAADDVFEILHALLDQAKENGDDIILSYVAPILVAYGEALIDAKGKPRIKKKLLDLKKITQLN